MARIQKSKKGNWRAEIRRKGFASQHATFKTAALARQWATTIEAEMIAGRYKLSQAADHRTAAEMIDRYLELVLPTKSTRERFREQQEQQLRWWRGRIGKYTLSNITQSLLAECRDELALSRKPATVNRYLAALSHVYTIAVKEWEWLEASPMMKLRKPKEANSRVRYLTDEERVRLLEQCSKQWRKPMFLIVVLALSTGARKMELLSIKWRDVDFARGVITLQHTKNNEQRPIFLWALAAQLLLDYQSRKHPRSELVFAARGGKRPMDIDREFRRAARAAGLVDFHFHDLRHTAASYLAMNGATTSEIAEVLGHKTLSMVKRYAHLSKTHTAGVVAAMNEKYFTTKKQQPTTEKESSHEQ